MCGSDALACGIEAGMRSYRHELGLLVVGPRLLPLPAFGAVCGGQPEVAVEAAVVVAGTPLPPISGSMVVALALPGEQRPSQLRMADEGELPPPDFQALVSGIVQARHEGQLSVDSISVRVLLAQDVRRCRVFHAALQEFRVSCNLVAVRRPLARIVVGPVIGRVTSSTAILLLEVDVACHLQCTLVDVISGLRYATVTTPC